MKTALVPLLLACLAAPSATLAQAPSASAKPAPQSASANRPVDLERFKQAITDGRRKMHAAAMGHLSAEQLQTYWAVYADFEKEKDAVTSARMDLAQRYAETFTGATGLTDPDIKEMITGDGGRPTPSCASHLGRPCACAALDDLDVELLDPPRLA